jgi:hypothetical protein
MTPLHQQQVYDLWCLNFTGSSISAVLKISSDAVFDVRDTARAKYTGGPDLPIEALRTLRLRGSGQASPTEVDGLLDYAERQALKINADNVIGIIGDLINCWTEESAGGRSIFATAAAQRFGGEL